MHPPEGGECSLASLEIARLRIKLGREKRHRIIRIASQLGGGLRQTLDELPCRLNVVCRNWIGISSAADQARGPTIEPQRLLPAVDEFEKTVTICVPHL